MQKSSIFHVWLGLNYTESDLFFYIYVEPNGNNFVRRLILNQAFCFWIPNLFTFSIPFPHSFIVTHSLNYTQFLENNLLSRIYSAGPPHFLVLNSQFSRFRSCSDKSTSKSKFFLFFLFSRCLEVIKSTKWYNQLSVCCWWEVG